MDYIDPVHESMADVERINSAIGYLLSAKHDLLKLKKKSDESGSAVYHIDSSIFVCAQELASMHEEAKAPESKISGLSLVCNFGEVGPEAGNHIESVSGGNGGTRPPPK